MSVDATALKAIAERVRRQTTNADVLTLCEAVISAAPKPFIRPSIDCPICIARRAAKAATMRKYRAKDKSNGENQDDRIIPGQV